MDVRGFGATKTLAKFSNYFSKHIPIILNKLKKKQPGNAFFVSIHEFNELSLYRSALKKIKTNENYHNFILFDVIRSNRTKRIIFVCE